LLQQSISATQLRNSTFAAQAKVGGGITGTLAGVNALVDIGLAHPLVQRHRVDTEIGGDLLDRPTVVAVSGNPHEVVTELEAVRLGARTSF
jgi:hypothetical protein